MNQPICVAEVNVLKLHFSQFVEKTPCIHLILHLRNRTSTENMTKWVIIQRLKWKHRPNMGQFQKYLFLFLKEFEHAFHVNERILDHSAEIIIITTRINQKQPSVESKVLQFMHFKQFLPVLTCSRFQTS